jgi:exodeoxyribonuclease-3
VQIATWNVNSVRARMLRLIPWLEQHAPDVVCLQETKCVDERFPREPIEELGYDVATFGQKTYNGVAILSKRPIEDVRRGLPGDGEDDSKRVLAVAIEDLLLVNVYVVNGERVGSDKYAHKLAWLDRLAEYIGQYDMSEKLIVAGDFNCTFDDRDVYDPEGWRERILCSTPEREALARVMQPGLRDAFRRFHEQAGYYTFWDYRTRGYERGNGLRIDHLLMSEPALEVCTGVFIDTEARGGEKPSDHAPVIATLD